MAEIVAHGSHRCVASSFSQHRPRQPASLPCHAQPTLYRGPAATAGRPASRLHRLRGTPCSGCGRTRRRRPTGSPGLPGARCEGPSITQAAGPGATLDAWLDCRLASVSAATTSRLGPKYELSCSILHEPEPCAGRASRRRMAVTVLCASTDESPRSAESSAGTRNPARFISLLPLCAQRAARCRPYRKRPCPVVLKAAAN